MTHIRCTTDPISDKALHMMPAFRKLPKIKDCKGDYCLSIYFESKKNRRAFRNIPVEPSTLDLKSDKTMWVDEG